MKKYLLIILMILSVGQISFAGDLDALFGYSFADELDSDAGDYESEEAFTLGVRYKDITSKGFGFNVGLGMDTVRDLDGTNAELGFFLLEGNASLALDQIKALYIFIGVNYPLIVYEDKNLNNVDPSLGLQFGTGLNIGTDSGVELNFRAVNFEFGSSDYNLWGFGIRGFYTFAAF